MEKNKGSAIYPKHRLETLEPYYSQHVSAMTEHGLHHKGDIAEQLAWRDQDIASLKSELEFFKKSVKTMTRYKMRGNENCVDYDYEEDEDGDWVRYDDLLEALGIES